MKSLGPICDPHIIELWEKIKPYLGGKEGKLHLRENAPPDIVEAEKELYRISWADLDQ